MSNAVGFLLADYLTRAHRARMCPDRHPATDEPCVLRWGHATLHKSDRCDRWSSRSLPLPHAP